MRITQESKEGICGHCKEPHGQNRLCPVCGDNLLVNCPVCKGTGTEFYTTPKAYKYYSAEDWQTLKKKPAKFLRNQCSVCNGTGKVLHREFGDTDR